MVVGPESPGISGGCDIDPLIGNGGFGGRGVIGWVIGGGGRAGDGDAGREGGLEGGRIGGPEGGGLNSGGNVAGIACFSKALYTKCIAWKTIKKTMFIKGFRYNSICELCKTLILPL